MTTEETTKRIVLYECGICSCLHPWEWDGDCRENAARFPDESDYAERTGVPVFDVEIRSWEERLRADDNPE